MTTKTLEEIVDAVEKLSGANLLRLSNDDAREQLYSILPEYRALLTQWNTGRVWYRARKCNVEGHPSVFDFVYPRDKKQVTLGRANLEHEAHDYSPVL